MNWPWNSNPTPEEVNSAIKKAEQSMAPNPLDHLKHLEIGASAFGILTYLGGGTFVDLSEICYINIHPESEPYILFRNGRSIAFTSIGATILAELIERRTKA